MAKQTRYECGQVIQGDSEREVMDGARDHIRADCFELLTSVTETDLRGWIEEV